PRPRRRSMRATPRSRRRSDRLVWMAHSHAIALSPDRRIDPPQEPTHAPERLDGDELDPVLVGHRPDLLPGREAEPFPDRARDDDLEFRGDGHSVHRGLDR